MGTSRRHVESARQFCTARGRVNRKAEMSAIYEWIWQPCAAMSGTRGQALFYI
jgi:hypothetical protein